MNSGVAQAEVVGEIRRPGSWAGGIGATLAEGGALAPREDLVGVALQRSAVLAELGYGVAPALGDGGQSEARAERRARG